MLRKNYTRSVNILFTPEQFKRLDDLAEKKGVNRSSAARTAIDAYCLMELDGVPTCANGQRCFVPTYHTPPVPQQQVAPAMPGPPQAQNRPV